MSDLSKLKPYCCNQPAKWVEVTQNLAYFYCESCKKEVTPNRKTGRPGGVKWEHLFKDHYDPTTIAKLFPGGSQGTLEETNPDDTIGYDYLPVNYGADLSAKKLKS